MLGISLYALISVCLLVAILRWPSVALAPLFCMFGFEQWAQSMIPFFTRNQEYTNVLVGVFIVLGAIVTALSRRRLFGMFPPVGYFVVLLFFYSLVSTLWAPRPDLSIPLWFRNGPYLLTFIALAPLLVSDTESLRKAMYGLFVMGSAVVAFTLMFSEYRGRFIVLAGTYGDGGGNPLTAAQTAGYVALSGLLLHIRRLKIPQLLLRWVFIGLSFVVVVKSGSRGQFLGLMGIMAIFGYIKLYRGGLSRLALAVILALMLVGIGGVILSEFAEEKRWTQEGFEQSRESRLRKNIVLLGHWYSTPAKMLFGLGNSASYDPEILGIYPHFMPIEILCEEGILGFIIYFVMLLLTFKSVRNMLLLAGSDLGKRSLVILLGGMFAFDFLMSLKQGSLLNHYDLFALVMLIGRYEIIMKKEDMSNAPLSSKNRDSVMRGEGSAMVVRSAKP